MPTITQAGIVTSSLTNVPASSYSYVAGFTTHNAGSAQHSINITTHAVGNLLISVPKVDSSILTVFTAPSSTNSTAWADCGEGTIGAAANANVALWTGRVSTVGTAALTVPYTVGTTPSSCLTVLEFTCPGVDAGTVWSIDAHGNINLPAATTNLSYPFLSPSPTAQSPEIYVGNIANDLGLITAGSTAGFSYSGSGTTDHNIQAFNTAITSPSAPNGVGNATDTLGYPGIAALIKATIAHAIFDNIRIYLQPVPTGRMWIISQIGFEFLPSNTLQTITANIVLNNRVIKPGINPNAGQFQGPPYVTVRAGDTMWVDLFGVPVGASAIANFLYNEYSAYAVPHDLGGVV